MNLSWVYCLTLDHTIKMAALWTLLGSSRRWLREWSFPRWWNRLEMTPPCCCQEFQHLSCSGGVTCGEGAARNGLIGVEANTAEAAAGTGIFLSLSLWVLCVWPGDDVPRGRWEQSHGPLGRRGCEERDSSSSYPFTHSFPQSGTIPAHLHHSDADVQKWCSFWTVSLSVDFLSAQFQAHDGDELLKFRTSAAGTMVVKWGVSIWHLFSFKYVNS